MRNLPVTLLLRQLRLCASLDILILAYYGLSHSRYGIRLWG